MSKYQPRRALIEDDPAPRPRSRPKAAPAVAEAHPAHGHGDYLSHRQILVVMGGLMAGMFLAALDQSIVGVALPKITSELGGAEL
jgi:hypothetical protein